MKKCRRGIAALAVFCMLFALVNYSLNVRHIISDVQNGNKRAKTQSAEKTVLHITSPPLRIQPMVKDSFHVVIDWQDNPVLTTYLDYPLYNRPPPHV